MSIPAVESKLEFSILRWLMQFPSNLVICASVQSVFQCQPSLLVFFFSLSACKESDNKCFRLFRRHSLFCDDLAMKSRHQWCINKWACLCCSTNVLELQIEAPRTGISVSQIHKPISMCATLNFHSPERIYMSGLGIGGFMYPLET